jgi:hypothetical protein
MGLAPRPLAAVLVINLAPSFVSVVRARHPRSSSSTVKACRNLKDRDRLVNASAPEFAI